MLRFLKNKKDGEEMVLYCAAIPVLIYPLVMHRIGVNRDKKAVLFIDRYEFSKRTDIDAIHEFKNQGIFDDVVDCKMFVDRKKAESDPTKVYIEHFDKLFANGPYSITDFNEIYILNDGWDGDINLYFSLKKIEYNWINCAKNYIPSPNTQFDWLKKIWEMYHILTPFAEYANPCILNNSDAIIKELDRCHKKYSIWNLEEIYENFPDFYLEKIGKCFQVDKLSQNENAVLIVKNSGGMCDGVAFSDLGESGKVLRIISGGNQYSPDDFTPFFDKIALDFFANSLNKIYIKEHPNCPINEIQKEIYNEQVFILPKITFELFTKYIKYKNIKFDSIIGYLSISLLSVDKSICNHLYILGGDFLKTALFYSSIYTVLCYVSYGKFLSIYCSSTIKSQLELLLKTVDFSINVKIFDSHKFKDIQNSLLILDYMLEGRFINKEYLEKIPRSSAVCFLNVDLTEDFFDESMMANFFPMKIKKERISEGFLNLQRDELLWIYTKNNAVMKASRFFKMEKILPRCGLRVYVEESTLADGILLFKDFSNRAKINKISKQIESLTKAVSSDSKLAIEILRQKTDLCEYLQTLKSVKKDYLILLSVRDTPGNNIPDKAIQALHELGLGKFSKELWRMYIGIINQGQVVCDISGNEREAPVSYTCSNPLYGMDISVSSMAWRQGNKAEIIINDTDYSVNIRGINIVVYDTQNKKLIDSVGFDYHDIKKRSLRN